MITLINYKKAIGIAFICFVIALHGFLRISQLPHAPLVLGHYFWIPALNVGAGKGLTDVTSYQRSPELNNFLHNQPFNKKPLKELTFFDSFHEFTDFTADNNILGFPESRGLRWVIGLAWKILGFNWYHVGLVNYFLSLLALLSLMACSYRTLGVTYSVAIGFIYSISTIEITYVASFGRDGIPLWFASYLISALIFMFSKPLILKRLISYSIGTGLIIFAAMECRASTIYFIPLLAIIYFFLFFFYEEGKINFKYSHLLKNSFLKKSFCFLLATILMAFVPLSLRAITNIFYPYWGASASWGVVFEGLGMWGGNYRPYHPSQVRYLDGNIFYFGEDYAQRILNLTYQQTQEHIKSKFGGIGNFIPPVYFSIVKTYPYFFIHDVVYGSFKNTLLYLGIKNQICNNVSELTYTDPISYFFYQKGSKMFESNYLFLCSIVGTALLYFRLNLKKMALILLSFMLYNACVSFLQFHMRHVLMGHSAYYFLSGVTIAFVYESYVKIFFIYIIQLLKKNILLKSKHSLYVSLFILLLFAWPIYIGLMNKLKDIEMDNIKKMQVVFDSLDKKPLNVDFTKEPIKLSKEFLYETIGIYCDLGEVTAPQKIIIKLFDHGSVFYYTEIMPVVGKNVTLFFPYYFMNDTFTIKFDDHNQCKSFQWSNLKGWDGTLWEGTYDRDTLVK